MVSATWLIKNSLVLDINFLKVSPWKIKKKINFLLHKYYLVGKHIFLPFKLGESSINLDGKVIYYDSRFGLAGFQSMMTRHQFLFQLARLKGIRTVIDIGANVGFFSLLAHDIFKQAKIFSLEPIPLTYQCLKKNLSTNSRVKTFQLGLGEKNKTAYMEFDPQLSAISNVTSKGNIKTKLITLDHFIKSQKIASIDLLKVDTEGFELHVFKGAHKALAKTRYLHLEVTLEDNENYTFSELLSQLYSPKYNFQLIAYRSYTDKSIGKATVFDLLLKNIHLK